jgi:hypothetical protein
VHLSGAEAQWPVLDWARSLNGAQSCVCASSVGALSVGGTKQEWTHFRFEASKSGR